MITSSRRIYLMILKMISMIKHNMGSIRGGNMNQSRKEHTKENIYTKKKTLNLRCILISPTSTVMYLLSPTWSTAKRSWRTMKPSWTMYSFRKLNLFSWIWMHATCSSSKRTQRSCILLETQLFTRPSLIIFISKCPANQLHMGTTRQNLFFLSRSSISTLVITEIWASLFLTRACQCSVKTRTTCSAGRSLIFNEPSSAWENSLRKTLLFHK